MKRVSALLLTCTLGLSALSGCSASAAPQPLSAQPVTISEEEMMRYDLETPAVWSALSEFGLDLLKTARQEGEGTLLSPLSAALALSMAANGADGETLDQFREVLGDGASLEALNVSCSALMKLYGGLGGSTECSIANSLWTDPEGRMQEDFVGRCSGIFDAQVFQEDLSAPVIVPALNSWVSDHTAGMIPQIIQRPFGEDAAALMVNALYLKNTWAAKFDPSDTITRDFTRADGTAEPLDFLQHFSRSLTYLQSGSDEGVLLPYDDGRLASSPSCPGSPPASRTLSAGCPPSPGRGCPPSSPAGMRPSSSACPCPNLSRSGRES